VAHVPTFSAFLVAIAFVQSAPAIAAPKAPVVTKSVSLEGPTIIAFLPPGIEKQKDDGAIEASAHVSFALEDTHKCLAPKYVKIATVFADRIIVRDGASNRVFVVKGLGQAVGAILLEPKREGKVIYTTAGPSTLMHLLPAAAWEYWHVPKCRAG
jgi:hypothetical protein